jgi:predicted GNAT family acetyltransferase
MTAPHPLDRPVWTALTTGWAPLAQGDGRALCVDPAYGPFVAAADDTPDARAALATLVHVGKESWVVDRKPFVAPPGLTVERAPTCWQMIAERPAAAEPFDYVELGEADAPEMRALAELTRPGPFRAATHRFGGFIGVRENGRLVAMAGQRMQAAEFAEVSGVCTHPDARGRGHAGRLMRAVAAHMIAAGKTPFLHVYTDNLPAIALYETLGYAKRAQVVLTVLRRN